MGLPKGTYQNKTMAWSGPYALGPDSCLLRVTRAKSRIARSGCMLMHKSAINFFYSYDTSVKRSKTTGPSRVLTNSGLPLVWPDRATYWSSRPTTRSRRKYYLLKKLSIVGSKFWFICDFEDLIILKVLVLGHQFQKFFVFGDTNNLYSSKL